MLKRFGMAAIAAIALPATANAHSFEAGANTYTLFLAGVEAVYADLGIALLILAAGLLIGLDKNASKHTGFAALLAGAIIGCALTVPFNFTPTTVLLLSATAVACLAAWRPAWKLPWLMLALGWAGGMAAWSVFAGHEEVIAPFPVYVGTLFALYVGVATTGAITKLAMETVQKGWMEIGFRAMASWVAAIAIMTLAFLSTGAA
ncbi:MAG: hypothetical protein WA921_05105 [Ahrensia sp.]